MRELCRHELKSQKLKMLKKPTGLFWSDCFLEKSFEKQKIVKKTKFDVSNANEDHCDENKAAGPGPAWGT